MTARAKKFLKIGIVWVVNVAFCISLASGIKNKVAWVLAGVAVGVALLALWLELDAG